MTKNVLIRKHPTMRHRPEPEIIHAVHAMNCKENWKRAATENKRLLSAIANDSYKSLPSPAGTVFSSRVKFVGCRIVQVLGSSRCRQNAAVSRVALSTNGSDGVVMHFRV